MVLAIGAAAAMTPLAAAPASAQAPVAVSRSDVEQKIADKVHSDLRPFYAARGYRPLWIDRSGGLSPAADKLLELIDTSQLDSINDKKLKPDSLRKTLRRAADGDAGDLAKAEVKLSQALAEYVRAMRAAPHSAMIYESKLLEPVVPGPVAALNQAAAAPSLEHYIDAMGWMHPLYAPLREALLQPGLDEQKREVIWDNLARVRALPGNPPPRYILVDTNSARLWMYENGKPVDSMRVVVGKPATPTPMIAGFVRYAILNPYWNVPANLVQENIATNVLDRGMGYLKAKGYQVLSGWDSDASLIPPDTIDWKAVAAGELHPRVRQLPGKGNFMGKVKFEFPNPQGIYLHDTPDKYLLRKEGRHFSDGCIRLQDADRLGRWLLNKPLPPHAGGAERRINLPQLVPVYVTYLTAMPAKGEIAYAEDVYGRDQPELTGDGDGAMPQLSAVDSGPR
jgi:murein L,D-transpeptidase YcbB/YkuD